MSRCPHCGAQLEANPAAGARVSCRACGAESPAVALTRPPLARPPSLVVRERPGSLRFSWRGFSWDRLMAGGMALAFFAAIHGYFALEGLNLLNLLQLPFTLLAIYAGSELIFGRRWVELLPGELRVKQSWFRSFRWRRSEIVQLSVVKTEAENFPYALNARFKDGSWRPIFELLESKELALYLQQALERRLGLSATDRYGACQTPEIESDSP